jgi:Redoxin
MAPPPITALAAAFVKCRDLDAPLNERLEAYSKAVRDVIPAYADAVDRLVARLSRSDAGAGAPQPGELMPSFVLPDETGRLTSLEALLNDGPLAITFHRGHWCPWCRISASALAKVQNEIMGTGGQVAAVVRSGKLLLRTSKSIPDRSSPCLRIWTMATRCR